MRSGIVFLFIHLSAIFTSYASARENAPTIAAATPAATRQKAATIPQRGTLYRVRHQGNTTYLFGTVHFGKAAFFPLEPQVTRALTGATRLVVELDIRNEAVLMQAMNRHGIYGAGDSIDRHLSRESLGRLRQTLHKLDIPFEQVAQMKPWLLTNLMIGIALERNGYSRSHGTEAFLLAFAEKHGKTVEELETADYQFSLLDGMTQPQQEQFLSENLAELANGKAIEKASAMIEAWGNADSAAFERLLRVALEEKTFSAEFLRRTLLDRRNPEMAGRIEVLLRNDRTTFIAVGLLHLLGDKGLPQLLRQRGYEVRKLY